MPFYSATMTLAMTSGVTADSVQNSYAFSGSTLATDPDVIADLLEDLYDALVTIYPSKVATSGHLIKVINLDDPQPRYPVLQRDYAFPTAPSGNTTCAEIAIGASFQAARQSGIPQARRRGRVYIGPIDASHIDNNGMINFTQRILVANAFDAFHAAAGASAVVWSVWSRVDGDLYAVNNGWVDDAPDIQRRRGVKASVRSTWS